MGNVLPFWVDSQILSNIRPLLPPAVQTKYTDIFFVFYTKTYKISLYIISKAPTGIGQNIRPPPHPPKIQSWQFRVRGGLIFCPSGQRPTLFLGGRGWTYILADTGRSVILLYLPVSTRCAPTRANFRAWRISFKLF